MKIYSSEDNSLIEYNSVSDTDFAKQSFEEVANYMKLYDKDYDNIESFENSMKQSSTKSKKIFE